MIFPPLFPQAHNSITPVVSSHTPFDLFGTVIVVIQVSEAVRDAKLSLLKELKSDEPAESAAAEALQAELLADWPRHLPLLLAIMNR